MKPVERLICPKCKILYERGSSCIRCGSPLVKEIPSDGKVVSEIDRSEQEEPQSPFMLESESEESLPAPEFKKEVLQAAPRPDVKKDRRPIPIHAPREPSPDRLDGNLIRRRSSPGKGLRNPLRLPLEIGSILVLVVAGGYLAWSIYPNFLTKRPDASMPLSRGAAGLASVSATSGSPTVTVTEPKAAKEIDKGNESSVPEGGVGATPALSKIPFSEGQERGEISNLLEKIRQANLQKDIALFMSCYSTAFKGREGKRKETLETWDHFNYLSLSYELKKLEQLEKGAHTKIEWKVRFSPKASGGQPQESKTLLDVRFQREEGEWRIIEVKTVG